MTDLGSRFSITSGINGLVAGRFGGRAASLLPVTITDSDVCLQHDLATPVTTGTLGFAFQLNPEEPACSLIVIFGSTAGSNFSVVLDPTGKVSVWSGSYINGTSILLGSSAISLFTTYSWTYCGIQATCDTQYGSVTININGSTALSLSGVANSFDNSNTITSFAWQLNSSAAASSAYVDDVYFCDKFGPAPYSGFLGVCRIQTVYPDGRGSSSEFTGSDLALLNWQLVNEHAMDDDSTYTSSTQSGNFDMFAVNAGLISTNVILAVESQVAARTDDEMLTDNICTCLQVSGITSNGISTPLALDYSYISDIYVANPTNGKSWTYSIVNSLQVGYRNTST